MTNIRGKTELALWGLCRTPPCAQETSRSLHRQNTYTAGELCSPLLSTSAVFRFLRCLSFACSVSYPSHAQSATFRMLTQLPSACLPSYDSHASPVTFRMLSQLPSACLASYNSHAVPGLVTLNNHGEVGREEGEDSGHTRRQEPRSVKAEGLEASSSSSFCTCCQKSDMHVS